MKMHHQQGVALAKMELAHGKSPALTAMARQIIAAQKKGIAQLEHWLAKQKWPRQRHDACHWRRYRHDVDGGGMAALTQR